MSAIRNVSVLQNLFCVTTGTASACVVLPPTTGTPVCGGSESTASPAFGLWSSDGIPNSFGGVYLDSSSSWVTYDASSIWNDFNSLNSTIVSMQTKNAELQCEAGVASALSAYVTAATTNYDAEARAAIDDAGAKLTSALNAKTALNNALWSARGTAHSGYMTAISAADSTQNYLSHVNANVASSIACILSLANAYGDFQIANRQNKLDGTTASNPRRGAYQSDVAWAQQTKSLRNQYRIASGTVISDYCATVANAGATYNAAALNAGLAAAQNYFNTEKAYSQNSQGAYVGYALADFAAAKAKALIYLTASTTQFTADYGKEAELAQSRASAYSLLLNNLQATLADADLTKFGTISTLKETFVHALATANDADDALADANATLLAAQKAQNETNYNEAVAEADAAYQRAWQNAWNDAFLDVLAEAASGKTTFDTITNVMKTALEAAGNSYRDTIFAAYEDFSDEALNLAKIYAYNQAKIDQGGIVVANAFENTTSDYDICFVAGTPILMADGSTKPIEKISLGDKVLAADHLNPEEEPAPASVVRLFDNGEKEVVKLFFGSSGDQSNRVLQEIVCTPEHPFYVINKGWVHARDLQPGVFCLSANGDKIAFVAREVLEEKQRVFNFEVKEKHTYFAGSFFILAHNWCGTLFGEEFVMPWSPEASWSLSDNFSLYLRMGRRAVVGTASGAATGATTGAIVGAGVGALAAGAGVAPGAATGATTGAVGGAVSGLIAAAMSEPYETLGETAATSGMNGAVSGVFGGVTGPLAGSSLSIPRHSYNLATAGTATLQTERVVIATLTDDFASAVSAGAPCIVLQGKRTQLDGGQWDAGNLEKIDKKRLESILKKNGTDPHKFKSEFLGSKKISKFNVSVNKKTGELVLTPVTQGAAPNVNTGLRLVNDILMDMP